MTIFEIKVRRTHGYDRWDTFKIAAADDDLLTAINSLRRRLKDRVWFKEASVLAETK